MGKFKKQTRKELKAIAEVCRLWPQAYLNQATKLFIHIKSQEQEIESLNNHLNELRQANFFKQQELINENITQPIKPKEAIRRYPLRERLAMMIRGSDEWNLTLKLNQLTEEQAQALIKEWNESRS